MSLLIGFNAGSGRACVEQKGARLSVDGKRDLRDESLVFGCFPSEWNGGDQHEVIVLEFNEGGFE